MEFLQDTNIWVLISFVTFLILAFRLGKDSVLNALDGRIEKIREELKTAENLHIEAQELMAQYQRKHRDAMQDADKIVNAAKDQAKQIKKQADTDLKQSMERREDQLSARLKRIEENAVQEIQSYAADLAMNAATQIITDKLDKKTSEKLVDNSIKNLSENIH